MRVHLLDGTYELFRYFFALPSHVTAEGREVGAVRGVLGTVLSMFERGATHLGVATDHVIESFRNELWPGYKSSAGVPPELLAQFPLIEEALQAMGVVVWPLVEFEADDGLAAAAAVASADDRVRQVLICTPDKDLGQCVTGKRIVQLDRRKNVVLDEAGVHDKFGVLPGSIPDYLALGGDSADGFPGLPGFGAKTAAALLDRYGHLEQVPEDGEQWGVDVRGAAKLARTLLEQRDHAYLFRTLATLRTEAPVCASVDELAWKGPTDGFAALCERIDGEGLPERAVAAARKVIG